ncbi:MAG: alpha/beta hydrolase [Abditibacteriales bacterium]|nr:alpha/beta hydrolase [Abditibacteriales bacterium]MDW8364886.1 alpha/beta hydrolase [Abditibacteriales bacterium]
MPEGAHNPMSEATTDPLTRSHRRARLGRTIKRALIAAPVAILGGSYLWAYFSIHPPKWKPRRTPQSVGVAYENVKFQSLDGMRLAGWFAPATDATAVIILCHGFPGTRSEVVDHLAFLHRAGFNVFTFDFRGRGESAGNTCTIGYREVNDLLGAVRYLRARPETKSQKIGVLGLSMGGAVCIMGAAREKEIAAVVADAPYARLDRAVHQRFRAFLGPLAPVFRVPAQFFGERLADFKVADVAPLNEVARISPRPLLLIHGTSDFLITPTDSKMLHAAARAPKQLWLVPGARHTKAYQVAGKEYERRVTEFFQKALR